MKNDLLEYWIDRARAAGFDAAAPLSPAGLCALPAVREMCAENRCRAYGRNWTCPPACGTIEECQARMRAYSCGLLVQTVGRLTKRIDTRAMRAAEERHLQNFYALAGEMRAAQPDALCLGAGGCRVCPVCACPDAPCRFPERACASMEGYGLFVTRVCRDAGLPYHHGEGTITYTACLLFNQMQSYTNSR